MINHITQNRREQKIALQAVILSLALLALLGTAASYTTDITLTIGGGADREPALRGGAYEFNAPINFPVSLELRRINPGCGEAIPARVSLLLACRVHGFYNPATGEAYLRMEETSYKIVVDSDGNSTVETRDNSK